MAFITFLHSNMVMNNSIHMIEEVCMTFASGVQGRYGAVSTIALAERGCLFDPGPCMYMEKMATGPDVGPHMVHSPPLSHTASTIDCI